MSDELSPKIHSDLIIDASGKPKGVMLSLGEYERIKQLLQDVTDLEWMESHVAEEEVSVEWDDVKKRLSPTGTV